MVEPSECSTDQTHFTSPICLIQCTANHLHPLEGWFTPVSVSIAINHKKFSKWKQAHVGMEPSKTSHTRWEQHHNTFTPSLWKGCSWLDVVHGDEVSFIPTKCFIRKKLTFRLLYILQSSSEHTQHAPKHCCVCSDEDCRIAVETSAFFQ